MAKKRPLFVGRKIKFVVRKTLKAKPHSHTLARFRYSKWVKELPLDEKHIFLESQHGREVSGNVFYLLQELCTNPKYEDYKVSLCCQDVTYGKIAEILDNYNLLDKVNLVIRFSKEYMKSMASAKYLFNDNTFLPFFTKKEGQVYFNTWHGTPLKTLGKGIKNAMHAIGNTQKNFVSADYLLYPNEYTMEHMVEDYMLENIATGECVLAGYPRNTIFFNKERGKEILAELGIADKRIYSYMPTWRGTTDKPDVKSNAYFQYYLFEIDQNLEDDEILFLNLHPIAKKNVDFSLFKHIRCFPENYETYDFLTCAECLVTDYSSVFYDYANTGNKIILFTYDEEDYFADRGVYKSISELPFPNVKSVDALLHEMRTPKQYDDSEFMKEYCNYDCPEATQAILDFTLLGAKSKNIIEKPINHNNKKNIVLYLGNLDKNGITTAALNLLNNLNVSEHNYFISFSTSQAKAHQSTIAAFPEGVSYFPIQGPLNLTFVKKVLWFAFNCKLFPINPLMKMMKNDWQAEIKRYFGGAHFDSAIQFTGYSPKMILLFSQFPCNNTIYVHSDMLNEIKFRGNQRKSVLKYAYKTYDNVALVTPDIKKATESFVKSTDNFKLAHNVIAVEEIKKRGEEEIMFDEDITRSTKTQEELIEILNSDAKKIISVGRFSPEKDHKRLIDAFNKVWKENNNTYFIIIGGNQLDSIYDNLCEYIQTLPCGDNVILILSMTNPMPIVKACDGFILGSHYEGFGLVIVEADILGVPAVSTDIDGPRIFMQENNGTLVENTPEGVEKGFRLLIDGKVPLLTADYKKYNENAINEFKSLI